MTSAPAARQLGLPPSAEEMLADADGLIERLMRVLDDRMTPSGHPYALVLHEHRGTCPPREDSVRCREYRALFVDGMDWRNEYREAFR